MMRIVRDGLSLAKILLEDHHKNLSTRVLYSTPLAALLVGISLLVQPVMAKAQQRAPSKTASQTAPPGDTTPLFRTNVRRVVVDVVVTDKTGKAVDGLSKQDFSVAEDGTPQQVLSFDVSGFSPAMDYLPPKLPSEPPNTFVNLPATPERGPLYVLLYDLVNMDPPLEHSSLNDVSIQMFARQQMMKFIKSKPEGARFAVFVRSDRLHLVQGFTSDKAQLLGTLNSDGPKPAIPKVFMMAQNYGKGNPSDTLSALEHIVGYLDGLPGRKNLIWFSASFPLVLFPSQDEPPEYIEETKKTLDMLAQDQIAIYPVDATGLSVGDPHAPTGSTGSGGLTSDARDKGIGNVAPAAAAASGGTNGGQGYSLLSNSYMIQNDIAQATGGRSFHSNNDLAGMLLDATEDGESYYTVTYAPSNGDYNGKVRRIQVNLAKKGYTLSYRRAYFGGDTETLIHPPHSQAAAPPPQRKPGDSLNAYMEHGAPGAHALIFGAHVEPVGTPGMGTAPQMTELAEQTAFFRTRRRNGSLKPIPPVKLQQYVIDYTVMSHQLQLAGRELHLEIAAAAYDADGGMLNAIVNEAGAEKPEEPQQPSKPYRARQVLWVPLNAATIRLAVRDSNTDRVGAMEVALPLAADPTATHSRTEQTGR